MSDTLTPQQLGEFSTRGILCLKGLLPPDCTRRAREAVLRPLARRGLWRDGAWHLCDSPKPQWPNSGLKTSKVIGNKHSALAALLEEPALRAVVDVLLGGHDFDRTIFGRPQVLFTLPNIDTWTVPTGWHVDFPRLASGGCYGVQLFTFLDDVEPRGGGTLVVAGSHRLFNEGCFIRASDLHRRLRRAPFIRDLYSEASNSAESREHLLKQTAAIGDIPVEVVELTGAPGDAYLTDLRMLHTGAPNARDHPRMMVTSRFVCADVMPELVEAYGWR